MALLTVVPTSRDGVELLTDAVAASVGGDAVPNDDGLTLLVVHNTSGAPITVTVAVQAQVDGNEVVDRAESVPAASIRVFGHWQTGIYNDADSRVQVAYSSVVDVFVKAIKPAA